MAGNPGKRSVPAFRGQGEFSALGRKPKVLGEIELCLQTGPKKERTILKPITLDLILNLGSKCTRCPKRRSRQIIYRSSSVFLYGTRICGVWGTKIAIALSSRSALCIFLMQWKQKFLHCFEMLSRFEQNIGFEAFFRSTGKKSI